MKSDIYHMSIHAELQIKRDGEHDAKKIKEPAGATSFELRWLRKDVS
jgi:hypothetical protein